jgi:hypothetical protein
MDRSTFGSEGNAKVVDAQQRLGPRFGPKRGSVVL